VIQGAPKPDSVEQRVQGFGQNAISDVLAATMMCAVMFGALQEV